jgi:hypothetical protein
MQNARSTAAISRASEGYHFSHDALVTCKLPIESHKFFENMTNEITSGIPHGDIKIFIRP